ncbi:MAG: MarR family transcriptional regulator [Oribacterium sp.]|jgi:hypothetical protein|nr:MarR family transcriptional regulator [Oribacterium sp.]
MINVAIVSPDHSLEPVDKVITEYDFGCHFIKYIYKTMSDIDGIYQDCKGKCDVIFFSGELGYHYIKNKFPDNRIPCAFTAYEPIDVLSILLNFKIHHPEQELSRVFCDFLTVTNHYMDLPQYLPKEECPVFYEDAHYDYRHITQYAKKLWDNGKIDCILSRSINNLKQLDALSIPYEAVFPSEDMIVKSIRASLNALKLDQINLKDEINVLVRLPFTEDVETEEQEYREATVYKLLADYRKNAHTHFSIRQGFNQFEVQMQLESGTFHMEKLRPMLQEFQKSLGFPFRIGIGLSSSKERARFFSERALLEANRYGRNDAFFVGEEGTVTGPLSQDMTLMYDYTNDKAIEFARAQGINETNVLKLISLFRDDPDRILTSHELSKTLGITARSASRILSKLSELKILSLIPQDQTEEKERGGHQGRPTHHYRFMAEAFREALL